MKKSPERQKATEKLEQQTNFRSVFEKIKCTFRGILIMCKSNSTTTSFDGNSSIEPPLFTKEYLLSLLNEKKYKKRADALYTRWDEKERKRIEKKYNLPNT